MFTNKVLVRRWSATTTQHALCWISLKNKCLRNKCIVSTQLKQKSNNKSIMMIAFHLSFKTIISTKCIPVKN